MNKEFPLEKILDLKTFLLNSKSVICFSLDLEGNILFCNEGYNRILGYDDKNIKDTLINPEFKALNTDDHDGLVFSGIITFKKTHLNSSYVSEIYKLNNELFFLCEYDGMEVEDLFKQMSTNTSSINNMNRELIKKEIMLKNAISQLKETQAMLIHSGKMNALGQLVAGIVHEINNPMTYVMANVEIMGQYFRSIKGFFEELNSINIHDHESKIVSIENLKEKYNLNYIFEDFSTLQKSTLDGGEKIEKIVSELRDYSRFDESEKSLANISECILSAINIAKPEIKRNSINVDLNFSKVIDIECYPAQLNQVFLNLIINAVQATRDNGNIIINLFEKEDSIIVEIKDNGIGILEENKNKIFEPFFTTKPRGKGVGLGLNLSYRIIKDMHKGKISFESEAGKGTKFTIYIPKGVI